MELDILSLEKSIAKLEEVHAVATKTRNGEMAEYLRLAAIKSFELAYGLSYNMLRRYLKVTESNPDNIDSMSFQNIISLGFERKLLPNGLEEWMKYREKRNIINLADDEEKAMEIFSVIQDFMRDASFLRDKLKERVANL